MVYHNILRLDVPMNDLNNVVAIVKGLEHIQEVDS